jgi:hypothetical protein
MSRQFIEAQGPLRRVLRKLLIGFSRRLPHPGIGISSLRQKAGRTREITGCQDHLSLSAPLVRFHPDGLEAPAHGECQDRGGVEIRVGQATAV